MFDLSAHLKKVEMGALFPVTVIEGEEFSLRVRRATIRDPFYFKAQAFLMSIATAGANLEKIQERLAEGKELTEEEATTLASAVSPEFKAKGFSEDIDLLIEYVTETLVLDWEGVENAKTKKPLKYDKEMLEGLVKAEPSLAIQVFGFSINPANYDEAVVDDAEKN